MIADNVVSPLGFSTSENFDQLVNDVTAIQHHKDSDRKSTRLNSSHPRLSRMPSSA